MELMGELFPICRSLTGDGVRQTLQILARRVPLKISEVQSGTRAFDWTVPDEWNIRGACILGPDGEKILDFRENNLHVVGYSQPIDRELELEELQDHIHSVPSQPEAIPYVFSYYRPTWGFCMSHRQREKLVAGRYRVIIDSTLEPGSLTYGEIVLPGRESSEVFFSTYVCHPSMANNELSGPVVATFLAEWLASQPRKHTYRLVFVPETIGSLVYLSRHLLHLQEHMIAGFNLSCLGDERGYSYLPSRTGGTFADKVALSVLHHTDNNFVRYSFADRGSDERQYCSPGADLPVVTLCRSLFRKFPEYHTSLDDLSFVSEAGLQDSLLLLKRCVIGIEGNNCYRATCVGEPQMGKRGLYNHEPAELPNLKSMGSLLDFLAYADGSNDLFDICQLINRPVWELVHVAALLQEEGLVVQEDRSPEPKSLTL